MPDIKTVLERCNGNFMLFGGCECALVEEEEIEIKRCKECDSILDADGYCENCGGSDIGHEPVQEDK